AFERLRGPARAGKARGGQAGSPRDPAREAPSPAAAHFSAHPARLARGTAGHAGEGAVDTAAAEAARAAEAAAGIATGGEGASGVEEPEPACAGGRTQEPQVGKERARRHHPALRLGRSG